MNINLKILYTVWILAYLRMMIWKLPHNLRREYHMIIETINKITERRPKKTQRIWLIYSMLEIKISTIINNSIINSIIVENSKKNKIIRL